MSFQVVGRRTVTCPECRAMAVVALIERQDGTFEDVGGCRCGWVP